jgi:hypothetical protein
MQEVGGSIPPSSTKFCVSLTVTPRPHRLVVRTPPFHGGNRGSNPLGDAIPIKQPPLCGLFYWYGVGRLDLEPTGLTRIQMADYAYNQINGDIYETQHCARSWKWVQINKLLLIECKQLVFNLALHMDS